MIDLPFYLIIGFELLLFFTGASIYSFLEVVIDRVPRKISFIKGRSMCDSCGHELKAFDLIPVFSWLFLGGKCRYCKAKIPVTLLLKELFGGLSLALGVFFITNLLGFYSWVVLVKVLLFFIFGCVCNVCGSIYIKTGKVGLVSFIFMAALAVLRFFIPLIEGHYRFDTGLYNVYYGLYGAGIMLVACVLIWFLKDKMGIYEWLFLVLAGFVLGGAKTCISLGLLVLGIIVFVIYKKCKKEQVKVKSIPFIPIICFAMHISSWVFVALKARF